MTTYPIFILKISESKLKVIFSCRIWIRKNQYGSVTVSLPHPHKRIPFFSDCKDHAMGVVFGWRRGGGEYVKEKQP